jgi:hypothetical protein
MSEFASQAELNGLGTRLNDLENSVSRCQGEHRVEIINVKSGTENNKGDIESLFKAVTEIKVQIASMSNRIIGAVAVIVMVINLVIPFIMEAVKK